MEVRRGKSHTGKSEADNKRKEQMVDSTSTGYRKQFNLWRKEPANIAVWQWKERCRPVNPSFSQTVHSHPDPGRSEQDHRCQSAGCILLFPQRGEFSRISKSAEKKLFVRTMGRRQNAISIVFNMRTSIICKCEPCLRKMAATSNIEGFVSTGDALHCQDR